MRYEDIKEWKDSDFKRLTGVKHETFKKMLAVLERELPGFGRPPKLSRADQLLMTLMYWREYRTQFHIGGSYGISEGTVCRTINIERPKKSKNGTTAAKRTVTPRKHR